MNEDFSSKRLLLGRVIRPHGLDGVLRVQSYAETGNSFLEAGSVFLKTAEDETREFPVVSARPHKKIVLLELGGLDSIEAAESLRGADVYVLQDALKVGQEDEFFWYELIGIEVYLVNGGEGRHPRPYHAHRRPRCLRGADGRQGRADPRHPRGDRGDRHRAEPHDHRPHGGPPGPE